MLIVIIQGWLLLFKKERKMVKITNALDAHLQKYNLNRDHNIGVRVIGKREYIAYSNEKKDDTIYLLPVEKYLKLKHYNWFDF